MVLSLELILQYFKVEQKKLSKLYSSDLVDEDIKYDITSRYDTKSLSIHLLSLSARLNDFYVIEHDNINSFIYSVLILVDENFISMDIDKYIKTIRKKMACELMEKKFYQKFGYNKKRQYRLLQPSLLNFEKPIDPIVYQYFADYFGINITILQDIGGIKHIFSLNDNDKPVIYKPMILLYQEGRKYSPIMSNDYGNILKYDSFVKLSLIHI